jgi:hypothetical protein
VSFFRSFREHAVARVIWFSGGNPNLPAKVYRRTESTEWTAVGDIFADGRGYLTFEDHEVADDAGYGYRLGIAEPDETESFLGETWVDPLAVAFAFAGRVVNPSTGGKISCSFELPSATRAEVRLYDVSGRELDRQVLEPGASGERTVHFGAIRRLRAGVYLLRASGAGRVVTKRVIVLD